MPTSSIAVRILDAIEGDIPAIQALAGALAQGDVGGIRGVLAARGVSLSEDEVASVIGAVSGDGATCTCTWT